MHCIPSRLEFGSSCTQQQPKKMESGVKAVKIGCFSTLKLGKTIYDSIIKWVSDYDVWKIILKVYLCEEYIDKH
jgi:hypothetical protein